MAIAITLKDYLETEGVNYDVVQHPQSSTSMQTAEKAHIPGEQIAKGVVLQHEYGYVMAVVPATHKVLLGKMSKRYHRVFSLASEVDLPGLFKDCVIGAVPPVGKPYGVDVIYDDRLTEISDIYFEAGDHADLVHVSGKVFRQLLGDVPHGHISRHI